MTSRKKIVVTGADGFVAKNLRARLRDLGHHEVRPVTRLTTSEQLVATLSDADLVIHLAGVNRPTDAGEFVTGNVDFTRTLCSLLIDGAHPVPIVYSSSTQAVLDNDYGRSKRAAEEVLLDYSARTGVPVYLARMTNVFGKWGRPHYNSAVNTFCYQLARSQPIRINDPSVPLRLLYVEDAVDAFVRLIDVPPSAGGYVDIGPIYDITVGELATTLQGFVDGRDSLRIDRVGDGLARALYSTYVSYLPPERFAYQVPSHRDVRGSFVEMLKTADSGQFSYFTAGSGVTRGEHYHHTKTEKFLVVKGIARFRFRNVDNGESYELTTQGGDPRIVESIPGWAHNITNVGDEELVVMLWANEVFDRSRPDTVAMKVVQ